MEAPNSTITQHLEGFLQTARKLEDALTEEKKRSQRIAQEYLSTRTTLENAVRELQNRLMQRENKIQEITQAFQNLQASETAYKNEIRDLSEREKKSATELSQYKKAWSEVLAREAQARGSIIELEKAKSSIIDQKNLVMALEQKLEATNQNAAIHSRHAETYQRELQSALIRIQSADSKYTQIQKELTVLTQNKRNADEEIARIEIAMKERFRWEIANEKERMRAELERDSALDRERFREVARNQMRAEIDRQVGPDRQARETAEAELAKIQGTIAEADAKRTQEVERSRARLLAVTEENMELKEELTTLVTTKNSEIESANARAERAERTLVASKNEAAMFQLESNSSQMKIETIRKDSSKSMLIERLRHDDEIRDLRAKIDALVDSGIYAEKVDEVPEGMRVYSATSLSSARSNRDGNVADHTMKSEESNLR